MAVITRHELSLIAPGKEDMWQHQPYVCTINANTSCPTYFCIAYMLTSSVAMPGN